MKDGEKIQIVYVLSTSYSGSTLLGYIIGSADRVVNLGEVNLYNKVDKKDEICDCEKMLINCKFWGDIRFSDYNFYYGTLLDKIQNIWRNILGLKARYNKLRGFPEYEFFQEVKSSFLESQEIIYVDVSKSLWRLSYLMRFEEVDLKVIYLKRDIRGVTSSFIKHGQSFMKGLLIYIFNNYLFTKFLNNKDFIAVDYENLCSSPQKEITRIGDYLNIDLSNYLSKIQKKEYHVPTGNKGTRKIFRQGFLGLKLDDSWRNRLNQEQLKIIKNLGY